MKKIYRTYSLILEVIFFHYGLVISYPMKENECSVNIYNTCLTLDVSAMQTTNSQSSV